MNACNGIKGASILKLTGTQDSVIRAVRRIHPSIDLKNPMPQHIRIPVQLEIRAIPLEIRCNVLFVSDKQLRLVRHPDRPH